MISARRGRPRDEAARAQVLASATELFTAAGYAATTVADVARHAGVAVQTIYSAFGSKPGLLAAAHDVAVAGDDDPLPLLERPWLAAMLASDSAAAGVTLAVEYLTASSARLAPLYAVIQSASSDPAVAEVLAELRRQRHTFSVTFADQLATLPDVRPDVDRARLADIAYALICVEGHEMLVTECGWSLARWREWIGATLLRELQD